MLDAIVQDSELDLKLATTLTDFTREQEHNLKNEKLALSEKTQVLEDEIASMAKLREELQKKISTVLEIFEREQKLSDEFAEKATSTKESIDAASRYIENLKHRLDEVDGARRTVETQVRMKHLELADEICKLENEKKMLRTELDEAIEERDDLMGRWQAKIEIQKQSDIESRLE